MTLLRSGRMPLAAVAVVVMLQVAGCSRAGLSPATDLPEPSGLALETTQTSVFYATGRSLLEEHKVVDSTRIYEATLEELLLAFPEENPDVAIVQPPVQANSVTLSDGLITVDWPASVLDFDAEDSEERIALAAVLATFGQFDEVEQVQFTVEGESSGEASNGKVIEDFWGAVSLANQPWDVIRVAPASSEETAAAS